MNINQIIERVEKVSSETQYRFVRTEKGKLFEQFKEENHIAIGWDYLTLYQLRNMNPFDIKDKIAEQEELDINTQNGKTIATSSYNKLMLFLNLKKGDIIISPSRNSDRLAFGQIIDDYTYEDLDAKNFIKRRQVSWYKIVQINNLNPIFYQVKSNHHSISSINRFAPHIDRVIGNLFQKDDNTHYVLNIGKEENISFDELNSLMDNIKTLLSNINTEFNLEENPEEFYIKINLQSKGALELIKSGKSLAVLAFLLATASCTDDKIQNNSDEKIDNFIIENRKILEQTTRDIDSLKINTDELTKPFSNGN